jgi:hypothetical protein
MQGHSKQQTYADESMAAATAGDARMKRSESLSRRKRALPTSRLQRLRWYFQLRLNPRDLDAILRPTRRLTREPTGQ